MLGLTWDTPSLWEDRAGHDARRCAASPSIPGFALVGKIIFLKSNPFLPDTC